ncbi:MAG: VOC family protein [Bacteroidetes bacterium]|nr:VOC family protein [Bacteroidota bacterium]
MNIESVTLVIEVPELGAAAAWFEAVLQRNPDVEPVPWIKEYNLAGACWLQIVQTDKPTDRRCILRLGTPDIVSEHSRLASLGIEMSEITEVPDVIYRCDFFDPYGNKITLYQLI